MLGGDKMPGRKCSHCQSTFGDSSWEGKGVASSLGPRLPGTCHRDGLQPPRLSDGPTVGTGHNPGVDAGRQAGWEAGSTVVKRKEQKEMLLTDLVPWHGGSHVLNLAI